MTDEELRFSGGPRSLWIFLVGVPVILLGVGLPSNLIGLRDALHPWLVTTIENIHFVALAGFTWYVFRREGVQMAEVGLSPGHLRWGAVAFGAVWVALNVIGVGIAVLTNNEWGFHLLSETQPRPVVIGTVWVLVAGFVEEFALRGYLQTKLIALRGDRSRVDSALGITGASGFFAVLHVPDYVLAGVPVESLLSGMVMLIVSGMAFGILYELTRNLYFVGVLHAFGNAWVLLIDWWTWPGTAKLVAAVAVVFVYTTVALHYRSRALGTELSPEVFRTDVA